MLYWAAIYAAGLLLCFVFELHGCERGQLIFVFFASNEIFEPGVGGYEDMKMRTP